MTATSVIGQRTKNTLDGRDADYHGYPILIGDLLAQLQGATYVARGSVHNAGAVARTKRMFKRAFQTQMDGGFSFVEVLTMCPTGWFIPTKDGPDYMSSTLGEVHIMGELKADGVVKSTEELHEENVRKAMEMEQALARGDRRLMDFDYPPEAEAFRKEFRAWLDGHLTDEFRGERPRLLDGDGSGAARHPAGVEPRARRGPVRGDRLARGVRGAGRRDHGAGRLRRGDAPVEGAGHAEPARALEHRARDHPARHRGAEAGAAPPDAAGRRHLVPGILRAGRRQRPRVAEVLGGARRRPLRRQRPEDVEHARPPRELVRAAGADRSRGAQAPRHLVPARRHDAARRRGASARHDHGREGVQRDLLHRRRGPEGRACSGRSTRAGGSR